jgi:small subunit ribosomal protein S2
MLATLEDQEKLAELSKKDRSRIAREVGKYRKSLEGIKDMTKLPDALFVIDVACEHIAISEARRLGIPIVAVVDTNCDPNGIDFVIGQRRRGAPSSTAKPRRRRACRALSRLFGNERVRRRTRARRDARRAHRRADGWPRGGRDQAAAAARPRCPSAPAPARGACGRRWS